MNIESFESAAELKLFRFVKRALHAKFLFITCFVVVAAAVMMGFILATPIYEGSSLLVTGQAELDRASDNPRRNPETAASLARVAESDEVVREAIGKIGLEKVAPMSRPPGRSIFARIRGFLLGADSVPQPEADLLEFALPLIKRNVSVRSEPNTNILRIGFRHPNAKIAADFSNALAQAFVDRQIDLFSRPGAAEFFQRQKKRFEEELERASDKLARFSSSSGTYSVEDQRELLLKRLNDLSLSLAVTRGAVSEKIGQRDALASQLKRLAPVTRSAYVTSLVESISGSGPQAARAAETRPIEDRVSDPPLLLVKVYQDSMVSLFQTNSALGGLENIQKQQGSEIAALSDELRHLSVSEKEFTRLQLAVRQATSNLDLYAKRTIEEQINAESNVAKFSTVKVMDRATQPLRPVFPNYMLAVLISAALGLMAAIAAIVVFVKDPPANGKSLSQNV